MCIKNKIIIIIIGLLSLIFFHNLNAQDNTTNLRGQIVTYNPYTSSYVPVPNVKVELMFYDTNSKSWKVLKRTYTDSNGMYYFYNVRHGSYYLRINDSSWYYITVIKIDKRYYQFQDLPKIII